MLFESDVVMKLCYIRQPLLIRSFCRKVTIQYIFCYVLWICCLSCTAIIRIFNGGFDTKLPTDAENPFVIHVNSMIAFQFIPNSAISFIRRSAMNFFYQLRNPPVLLLVF